MNLPWLTLLAVLPAFGGLVLVLVGARAAKQIALVFSLLTLVVAAALWWLVVRVLTGRPERTSRPPRGLRLGWFDVDAE